MSGGAGNWSRLKAEGKSALPRSVAEQRARRSAKTPHTHAQPAVSRSL